MDSHDRQLLLFTRKGIKLSEHRLTEGRVVSAQTSRLFAHPQGRAVLVGPLVVPVELAQALAANAEANARFQKMPPSHRRAHADYVMEAKQEATRIRRAAKTIACLLAEK